MANKHASLDALFTDIADAIREKTGDTASIIADEFPNVIRERLQMIPPISFTIQGISYLAEDGMTWEQWINSKYNTIGLTYAISPTGNKVVGTSSDFSDLINGLGSVLLEDSSPSISGGHWDTVDKILAEEQVIANEQYGLYKTLSRPIS